MGANIAHSRLSAFVARGDFPCESFEGRVSTRRVIDPYLELALGKGGRGQERQTKFGIAVDNPFSLYYTHYTHTYPHPLALCSENILFLTSLLLANKMFFLSEEGGWKGSQDERERGAQSEDCKREGDKQQPGLLVAVCVQDWLLAVAAADAAAAVVIDVASAAASVVSTAAVHLSRYELRGAKATGTAGQ